MNILSSKVGINGFIIFRALKHLNEHGQCKMESLRPKHSWCCGVGFVARDELEQLKFASALGVSQKAVVVSEENA